MDMVSASVLAVKEVRVLDQPLPSLLSLYFISLIRSAPYPHPPHLPF